MSKGILMPQVFEQSSAARQQAWEAACADGNYDLARSIAEPSLSSLPLVDQLETVKLASAHGVLLRSDAMRIRGELEDQVLAGGTPLDQSIFSDIAFLDELLDSEA